MFLRILPPSNSLSFRVEQICRRHMIWPPRNRRQVVLPFLPTALYVLPFPTLVLLLISLTLWLIDRNIS